MGFRKADRLYYSAEAEAHIELMGAFPCIEDLQLFYNHITSRGWYKDLAGDIEIVAQYVRRVQVCGTHRRRGIFYVDHSLGRLHEGVALHEAAHPPTFVADMAHFDHGPAFIRAHLTILDHMIDEYTVEQFRLALKKRGFTW